MDCMVFLSSVVALNFFNRIGFYKAIRTLRILKLSQFIQRLRMVVISLIRSLPFILYLIIFAFSFLLFMAMFPLKYLKGQMYYCDGVSDEFNSLIVTKWDCFDYGGDWLGRDFM